MNDRSFYIKELDSEQCLCERKKKSGYSFCYRCYWALPPDLRNALWSFIGQGYEEAFDEACQWLQTEIW